jgi:hypothetical protein
MFTLPPTDRASHIRGLAERCLRSHPNLALKNLSCDYGDGVLVLRGCLPTYYLKQLAQEAVGHLKGIKRIDNHIEVVAPPFRSCQGQGSEG